MKSPPVIPALGSAIFLTWIFLAALPTAWADIYSWTDANGIKHYANKPPQGRTVRTRRSPEIPYDAIADQKNQEAENRYFTQRAMDTTLRRLEETERALEESLERAREAEARAEEWIPSEGYDDGYSNWDDGYCSWGGYDCGGDSGYHDGRYDRGRRREFNRRDGRRSRHPRKDARGYRSKGKHFRDDNSKEARLRKHKRVSRPRLSKRERGVRSGLTRVVRAVPSPYYMGYRPVYSGSSTYESSRGSGGGRRAYRRGGGRRGAGGGGLRAGGRGRLSF